MSQVLRNARLVVSDVGLMCAQYEAERLELFSLAFLVLIYSAIGYLDR